MARPAKGQLVVKHGKNGRVTFAARFRVNGTRYYETLTAMTREDAEQQLRDILDSVRLGYWRPPAPEPVVGEQEEEQSFHQFASEWLEARKSGLTARTYEDYRWALTHHLLPFFKNHRLSEITVQEVDRYRDAKLAEGVLSPNTLNKTLTRLSQILGLAVEYGLVASNPAAGRRRKAKGTKPRRPWAEPEQLMSLLEAAEKPTKLLAGRGRPLLAMLAGAGLRIDEALSFQRQHVNLAKGTLTVVQSKAEAGIRVVDLPPALRDELATYLDASPHKKPTDLVFATSRGRKDNPSNVRRRLFEVAIERANKRLAGLGIEPLGAVRPHGLRRTYASLRCVCGDDPVTVSRQIGHEDVRFTLNVYAQAVKRRERLTEAERKERDRAIEWASWATPAEGLGSSARLLTGQASVETTEIPD
jgi:integrase